MTTLFKNAATLDIPAIFQSHVKRGMNSAAAMECTLEENQVTRDIEKRVMTADTTMKMDKKWLRTGKWGLNEGQRKVAKYTIGRFLLRQGKEVLLASLVYNMNAMRARETQKETILRKEAGVAIGASLIQLLTAAPGVGKTLVGMLVMMIMLLDDDAHAVTKAAHERSDMSVDGCGAVRRTGAMLVRMGRINVVSQSILRQMLQELRRVILSLSEAEIGDKMIEVWMDTEDPGFDRICHDTLGGLSCIKVIGRRGTGRDVSRFEQNPSLVVICVGIGSSKQSSKRTREGEEKTPIKAAFELLDEGTTKSQHTRTSCSAVFVLALQASMSLLCRREYASNSPIRQVIHPATSGLFGIWHMTPAALENAIVSLLKLRLLAVPPSVCWKMALAAIPLMPAGLQIIVHPTVTTQLLPPQEDLTMTVGVGEFVKIHMGGGAWEVIQCLFTPLMERDCALVDVVDIVKAATVLMTGAVEIDLVTRKRAVSALVRIGERLSQHQKCAVCYEEATVVLPCCTVTMCKGCLCQWRCRSSNCPVCKKPLSVVHDKSLGPCGTAAPARELNSVVNTFARVVGEELAAGCKRMLVFVHDTQGLSGSPVLSASPVLDLLHRLNFPGLRLMQAAGPECVKNVEEFQDMTSERPMLLVCCMRGDSHNLVGLTLTAAETTIMVGEPANFEQLCGRSIRMGSPHAGKVLRCARVSDACPTRVCAGCTTSGAPSGRRWRPLVRREEAGCRVNS